jgi:hypothetical protein
VVIGGVVHGLLVCGGDLADRVGGVVDGSEHGVMSSGFGARSAGSRVRVALARAGVQRGLQ